MYQSVYQPTTPIPSPLCILHGCRGFFLSSLVCLTHLLPVWIWLFRGLHVKIPREWLFWQCWDPRFWQVLTMILACSVDWKRCDWKRERERESVCMYVCMSVLVPVWSCNFINQLPISTHFFSSPMKVLHVCVSI